MRVYIDMDDVLCAFTAAHRKALEINSEIRYPQSVEGFFLMLEPLPGAIEVVNEFRSKFEVYILTAPSTRNPLCYTEKRLWIEKHFDYEFTNQLIISPNKGLMIGDYLIDDHIEGRGQEDFLPVNSFTSVPKTIQIGNVLEPTSPKNLQRRCKVRDGLSYNQVNPGYFIPRLRG